MRKLNVAVVGAGLAGLCVAKYAQSFGHSVTIFEQCEKLGGTWIYREETGLDEYSLPIHTSMYQNLRTNLPKEIMGFRDYPMPQSSTSYISSQEVLSYIISYAEHFKLNELIKFKHHVTRVRVADANKWEVTVKDLPSNTVETCTFDAIFVCNGHNTEPFIPKYDGIDEFQGRHIHSHDYRRAEAFKEIVLIIGAGPSGIDLAYLISASAKNVILSHHTHDSTHIFPTNVIRMGPIQKFTRNGATFIDGSEVEITDIIFCTGYKFSFPFLDDDCGLHIDENYISPLYKHCINAEHTTMALIGYVFSSAITQMIDIQVRFVMQYLNGNAILPSRDEMLADSENQLKKRLALGWPKKKGHSVGGALQREYFNDLSTTANIEKVRAVYLNIYDDTSMRRAEHPKNYRNDVYTIIDDEHFIRTALPHSQ